MASYQDVEGRILTEEDAPQLNEDVDNIVVVDGLPNVDAAKFDKLNNFVTKVFSKDFEVVKVTLAKAENGGSAGHAFVEFHSASVAAEFARVKDETKFDKNHKMQTVLLRDFDEYLNTPDTFESIPDEEYDDEQENLWSWMLEENCLDQYVTREGTNTKVSWNTKSRDIEVFSRDKWTDMYVAWSPKGTYLATFHKQGIALWGGPKWKRLARFEHPGVKLIDFSPCERYLITWSNEAPNNPRDPTDIIVWDIKTGEKKRGFPSVQSPSWPVFKWSHDDKYFAKMGDGVISIYETPSMGLLNKKSVRIPDVQDFSWSPSDNFISYWVPEDEQKPARVALMSIPERQQVMSRNIYSVKECKMTWQENGDYLCVKVDRFTRSKKGQFTNFELFHMREKGIPYDSLEIKDKIEAFAWEPCGNKFAIIHGASPRICVTFYQLQAGKVSLLHTFEKMNANGLFWSPRGQYCVVAGLGDLGGDLEFVDTADMAVMSHGEHFKCTDVEWDPTGRYVCSIVSYWRYQVDTGYFVWTFQGRLLQKHQADRFYQLLWRPKQKSLLDESDQASVNADWKTWQSKFEAQDKMEQSAASTELIDKRRKAADSWQSYRRSRLAFLEAQQNRWPKREALGELQDSTTTFEIFVKEEVEVVA